MHFAGKVTRTSSADLTGSPTAVAQRVQSRVAETLDCLSLDQLRAPARLVGVRQVADRFVQETLMLMPIEGGLVGPAEERTAEIFDLIAD